MELAQLVLRARLVTEHLHLPALQESIKTDVHALPVKRDVRHVPMEVHAPVPVLQVTKKSTVPVLK